MEAPNAKASPKAPKPKPLSFPTKIIKLSRSIKVNKGAKVPVIPLKGTKAATRFFKDTDNVYTQVPLELPNVKGAAALLPQFELYRCPQRHKESMFYWELRDSEEYVAPVYVAPETEQDKTAVPINESVHPIRTPFPSAIPSAIPYAIPYAIPSAIPIFCVKFSEES